MNRCIRGSKSTDLSIYLRYDVSDDESNMYDVSDDESNLHVDCRTSELFVDYGGIIFFSSFLFKDNSNSLVIFIYFIQCGRVNLHMDCRTNEFLLIMMG